MKFQFKTTRLAGGLKKLGVKKGDRVLIYMPLIPEAIMSMLATVRLGAIHSVVFGGKRKKINLTSTASLGFAVLYYKFDDTKVRLFNSHKSELDSND